METEKKVKTPADKSMIMIIFLNSISKEKIKIKGKH